MNSLTSVPFQEMIFSWLNDWQLLVADRALIAIGALLLTIVIGAVTGPFQGRATPFYWQIVEFVFALLAHKMNRSGRPQADLVFRGFLFAVFVMALTFALFKLLEALAALYNTASLLSVLFLSLLLAGGAAIVMTGHLYRTMRGGKPAKGGYYALARSARADLSQDDDYSITRVAVNFLLRQYEKGIVTPIIWYLLFGLPAAALYAALAALSHSVPFESEPKSRILNAFAAPIAAMEKLMAYIPHIISGLILALAGLLTPTARSLKAFGGFIKDGTKNEYEAGGLVLTAGAYALNVTLGGPFTTLEGRRLHNQWIGPAGASAQLNAKHLHRAAYLVFAAILLWVSALGGLIWIAP